MPEKSAKYGLFVDNQGTGSVYSSLITRQGLEGEDEALISIYREGETKEHLLTMETGSWLSHQMTEV